MQHQRAPQVVGLLCGREYSFPPAFIAARERARRAARHHAEMVKLGGTKMDEPARYSVIVDRISHEVEYYRGAMKHAVLRAPTSSTTRSGGRPTTSIFNYSVMAKLGVAIPRTCCCRRRAIRRTSISRPSRCTTWSIRSTGTALLDYVGRPAILKPYSGGGWKHVYKVNDKQELLEAYDGTAPYCMTLQQFINFDKYVRCFTFGKTDITPVAYDPRERRYLVEHEYLSAELGARVVRDAQLINLALGYEMNTIEFAVEDGVPYAIDYLNPAPDFERDRITPFYFSHVVEKMAQLVVDRALNGHPRSAGRAGRRCSGIGPASGFTGAPGLP